MPNDPLYIVGPTATGKSNLAALIAEQIGGEIVGADAFQVYQGLDILTAKPDAETLRRVPHHLIGDIPLTESFDVARYRQLATERIADIASRGKIPVVVGGTGLYVRSLTHGLAELPPPDPALREELSSKALEELIEQLIALDPVCASQIDRHNPRRVIRALEVCLLSGRPFSSFREQWNEAAPAKGVVITRDRDELYRRIDQRTLAMFNGGVVEEVRAIAEISATASQAIGFRDIRALLAGELSQEECISHIQQRTRNYAKRQLTWFRKESHFRSVTFTEAAQAQDIVRQILTDMGICL